MNKINLLKGRILVILLSIFQFGYGQYDWQNTCGTFATTSATPLSSLTVTNADSLIVIPTVFHVLTQGGPENISKSSVVRALQILNQDFNRLNPDTLDIPAAFHPLRGNPRVEFRLARIDPEGNCTDGIDRIYSPQTGAFNNYYQMQPNFSWDHTRYMNIYVVKWIDYDNYPLDLATSYIAPPTGPNLEAKYDALLASYFILADGLNGVSPGARGHLLSHEMGHNLGLKHIWGNTTGCADDDDVTDTPLQNDLNLGCPTFPHISCNNGPAGDMFNNFMDYSECVNMFTAGQVDRMRACLANNEWRTTLWTPSNLAATGVDLPASECQNTPIADFGYGNFAGWLSAGQPVEFYEASTWSPDTYLWEFTGGIPATSVDLSPSVVFPVSGMHRVTLIVSNSYGTDTIAKNILIQPAEVYYDGNMIESFEDLVFNQQIPQWTLEGKNWSVTNDAAYSGIHSIRLDSSLQYFSSFFTHIYDLGKSGGTGRTLEFKVALGVSPAGSIAGGLRVIWKRPGAYERYELIGNTEKGVQSAALHSTDALLPSALQTAVTTQFFVPNSTQWKTITLPIPDTLTGEIQFGFNWGSFVPTTKLKGLYIDDINVNSLNGISEISSGVNWRLFPNPVSKQLNIAIEKNNKKLFITITDITGRVMYTTSDISLQNIEVSIESFPDGVYVVQIQSPDFIQSQKFVVVN